MNLPVIGYLVISKSKIALANFVFIQQMYIIKPVQLET